MEELTLLQLVDKAQFSILIGKNGSGKSSVLRGFSNVGGYETNYITPERGGTFGRDSDVERNMEKVDWIFRDRLKNRTEQFRQQSFLQFRQLELQVLRDLESDPLKRSNPSHLKYSFDALISRINTLLPNVELRRQANGFCIFSKSGNQVPSEQISSGEAELISLGIEILSFSQTSEMRKALLIDEPDVHLHPDAQYQLCEFLESVARDSDMKIVLATHSTALISGFSEGADLQVVLVNDRKQKLFKSFRREKLSAEMLQVFSTHALSRQFNRAPILLVEGEDDKRVVEQIVRSSSGRWLFAPCVVGGVSEMRKWETWLADVLPCLYDSPVAYSLRDCDESQSSDIDDVGCVQRLKLNCYAIENLILSDDCFVKCGTDAARFKDKVSEWIDKQPLHKDVATLRELVRNFAERRTFKIKDVRNTIVFILGESRPWEVLVGQLIHNALPVKSYDRDSIANYLGEKVVRKLFEVEKVHR